ncbi:unnamed protein product [Camellia sinensis]
MAQTLCRQCLSPTKHAMVMDLERSSSSSNSSKKRKQDGGGGGANCVHPIAKGDHSTGILRSLRDVPPAHYTFKIEYSPSFLNSKIENLDSGVFEAGGYKWKLSLYPNGNKKRNVNGHISLYLMSISNCLCKITFEMNTEPSKEIMLCLYPKGNGTSEGKDLSVFLQLADSKNLLSEWKLYAEYKLRMKNQINMKHFERGVVTYWFSASGQTFGYQNFMSLNDLNNAGKGFKVNDVVIIEAQIMLLSSFEDL